MSVIKTNKAGDGRGPGGRMPCRGVDGIFVYRFIWVENGSQGVGVSSRQVLARWVGSLGAE